MSEEEWDDEEGGVIKKFMYVNRRAPYGTVYALESLEVVLIGAAFDQDVSVVFIDDGDFESQKGQETAEIGIKAAQTGHLVLSTLHTNSAAETLTRLLNMGVPAFNVASTVDLIIAQRLARRLCKNCSEPADDIPHETLLHEGFTEEMLEEATVMKAVGCDQCLHGYKGRVGIYEVVRITPTIARIAAARAATRLSSIAP